MHVWFNILLEKIEINDFLGTGQVGEELARYVTELPIVFDWSQLQKIHNFIYWILLKPSLLSFFSFSASFKTNF